MHSNISLKVIFVFYHYALFAGSTTSPMLFRVFQLFDYLFFRQTNDKLPKMASFFFQMRQLFFIDLSLGKDSFNLISLHCAFLPYLLDQDANRVHSPTRKLVIQFFLVLWFLEELKEVIYIFHLSSFEVSLYFIVAFGIFNLEFGMFNFNNSFQQFNTKDRLRLILHDLSRCFEEFRYFYVLCHCAIATPPFFLTFHLYFICSVIFNKFFTILELFVFTHLPGFYSFFTGTVFFN